MADGQSIFGTDTSRYQALGTYDPGGFEIVNVDDPNLGAKVSARNGRLPWGVYLWIYPGHDVAADARSMIARTRALGAGDPPAGYWADYEDAGINPGQLAAFFSATDAAGVKAGYYSGPSALDHGPFLNRPWWNAAYPTGAEAFPGYGALWSSSRPRPMQLWQYTSANGLDRNVVVDEPWWSSFTGASASVESVPQEDDMTVWLCLEPGDMSGAWVQEGPYLLIRNQNVNAVTPGRACVVSATLMKQIFDDVTKARTAAGIDVKVEVEADAKAKA